MPGSHPHKPAYSIEERKRRMDLAQHYGWRLGRPLDERQAIADQVNVVLGTLEWWFRVAQGEVRGAVPLQKRKAQITAVGRRSRKFMVLAEIERIDVDRRQSEVLRAALVRELNELLSNS